MQEIVGWVLEVFHLQPTSSLPTNSKPRFSPFFFLSLSHWVQQYLEIRIRSSNFLAKGTCQCQRIVFLVCPVKLQV